MEHSSTHIIKKQVLDIKFPARYKESDYYSAIKDLYYHQILPRLEKIAGEYDPEILYQIDVLDIDLGTLPMSSINNEFSEKVEKSFREMLKKAITEAPDNNENVRKFSHNKHSDLEVLSFFLTTGNLPWQIKDKQTYDINSLLSELWQQSPEELKQLILGLSTNQTVIERIQHQFNAQSLNFFEQVFYNPLTIVESFVRTGSLPWWVADKKNFDVNAHILKTLEQPPAELKHLLIEISTDPEIVLNLQKYLSKDTLGYIEHLLCDPDTILVIFLKTGSLPWWAFNSNNLNINTVLMEIQKLGPEHLKALLIESIADAGLSEKIYDQLSSESLEILEGLLEQPLSILEFFLRTGNLPPLITQNEKSFSPDKLLKQIKEKHSGELETLINQLIAVPDVINRIQYQFNDESVVFINAILVNQLPIENRHTFEDLFILFGSFDNQQFSIAQYNRLFLPVLAEMVTHQKPVTEFIDMLITTYASNQGSPAIDIYLELLFSIADIDKLEITKSMIGNILNGFKDQLFVVDSSTSSFLSKPLVNILIKSYQEFKMVQTVSSNIDKPADTFKSSAPLEEQDSQSVPGNKKKTIAIPNIEESYIENAGMVLLWPYLGRFFENINYTENGQFKNIEFQKRAIHMLHYLVWDEEQCPEYSLLLNKILCGYNISKPIELIANFKKDEKDSAQELLDAVIKNWPILKNTSANGLRQTFLQRQGVLRLQDNNWTLTVEQKAFDILIEQLPWPIGIIKLPWMNQILYVEW
jgi:hypothetical protein